MSAQFGPRKTVKCNPATFLSETVFASALPSEEDEKETR